MGKVGIGALATGRTRGFEKIRPSPEAREEDFIDTWHAAEALGTTPERFLRNVRNGRIVGPVVDVVGLPKLWHRAEILRLAAEWPRRKDYMTFKEVMKETGYNADRIRYLMTEHDFPQPVRRGHGKRSWWRRAEVEAWVRRRDELRAPVRSPQTD